MQGKIWLGRHPAPLELVRMQVCPKVTRTVWIHAASLLPVLDMPIQ
jgi:hypothetical protein